MVARMDDDFRRVAAQAKTFEDEARSGVRVKAPAPEWPPGTCLEDYRETRDPDHAAGFNSGRWVASQRLARMLRQRAHDARTEDARQALLAAAEAAELGEF